MWQTTKELATQWGVSLISAHSRLSALTRRGDARRMPLRATRRGNTPTYWDVAPLAAAGPPWSRLPSTPGTTPQPISETTTKGLEARGDVPTGIAAGGGSHG